MSDVAREKLDACGFHCEPLAVDLLPSACAKRWEIANKRKRAPGKASPKTGWFRFCRGCPIGERNHEGQ